LCVRFKLRSKPVQCFYDAAAPNKTLQPTVKRFTIFAKNAKIAPLLPAAELGVMCI